MFSAVDNHDMLQSMTMADLLDLWRLVLNQFSLREVVVMDLDASLHAVEKDRVGEVGAVFIVIVDETFSLSPSRLL